MTFHEFADLVDEEMNLVPDYVYDELNGNVVVEDQAYLHPARVADDLYILGTYHSDPILGKQIRIYYGSFAAVLGNSSKEAYRKQVRKTLRHEFLHHLETRAGIFGKDSLIEEDRQQMLAYYARHEGEKPG